MARVKSRGVKYVYGKFLSGETSRGIPHMHVLRVYTCVCVRQLSCVRDNGLRAHQRDEMHLSRVAFAAWKMLARVLRRITRISQVKRTNTHSHTGTFNRDVATRKVPCETVNSTFFIFSLVISDYADFSTSKADQLCESNTYRVFRNGNWWDTPTRYESSTSPRVASPWYKW